MSKPTSKLRSKLVEDEMFDQFGELKLEYRPVLVQQLLDRLNSDQSPRQKMEMCFDSRSYSAVLNMSQNYRIDFYYTFTTTRTLTLTLFFSRDGEEISLTTSGSQNDAFTRLCKSFVANTIVYLEGKYPVAQMDSTESTEQGPDVLEGEKMVNTIMTTAVPRALNHLPLKMSAGILDGMCCGQESPTFPVWQDRMIVLSQGVFSTANTIGQVVQTWTFPTDILRLTSTPVNRPFEQFMFTKPNIHLRIKVNSQKFCTGRYLLSYYYEPFMTGLAYANGGVMNAKPCMARDHVLIDLGESNEGEIKIAFRNKCPFTTSLSGNQAGFIGAANVMARITCLVPMRVGTGQATTAPYTAFVSMEGTKFIGMRYAISPATAQMGNAMTTFKDVSRNLIAGAKTIPVIGGMIGGAANTMGNLVMAVSRPFMKPAAIENAEKDLKYIGIINNRDKPLQMAEPHEQRFNMTGNLAAGTNVAESILTFRLDPTATCINLHDHLPEPSMESVFDMIRIWTLHSQFDWQQTTAMNTELWSEVVMPGYRKAATAGENVEESLLDSFANFYTYYAGEIEYRFDFICNQFHTGIITIAYIPYHDAFNAQQATSGYWKVCDLREQKSFNFTVPYINNTVVRMLNGSTPIANNGIVTPSPGSIKLFVSNPLNPIETVPTTVTVLVYKRAGPNFRFSYPRPILGQGEFARNYGNVSYGVVAQMDDGESETVDQTPDFQLALPGAPQIQTNEDHMNIKDLMRRWTAFGTHSISAGSQYFIPVTTWPVRDRGYQRSLQAFIARQFKYYRGSIRFMFLFSSADFVYVTHVPQGTLCAHGAIGNAPAIGGTAGVHFNSYATQVCLPRINPVMKVEVPWHGVYDYMEMQLGFSLFQSNALPPPNFDLVALNLGHLIITPSQDITCSVFIAMGDDAELLRPAPIPVTWNWVGTQQASLRMDEPSNPTVRSMIEEDGVEAQMDDNEPEVDDPIMAQYTGPTDEILQQPGRVTGFCSAAYRRINDSMVSALRPVRSTVSAVASFPRVANKMELLTDKAEQFLDYIKDAARGVVEGIKKSLPWVTGIGAIFSSVLHFFHTLISPSWETFCISIVGVIVSLGCFCSDMTTKLMDFFLGLRMRSPTDHRTEEPAEAHCQHDNCSTCRQSCDPRCRVCADNNGAFTDETIGTLVSLMFASVCAALGWKGEAPGVSIAKGLFNFSKNFWLTIHQSGRFITSLITLIKRLFKYIGKVSGLATTEIVLTEQNNSVTNFVSEATLMLDQRNIVHLETNAELKYRFWYCVAAAHQMIARFTGSRLPEAVSVLRLAYRVVEKGNSIAVQSMACPVRYEPFVLSIAGDSKIGKSYMLQHVLPEILASEAYGVTTHAPPVFVRTPGVEFWNSYQNQPCILYDDFLAVTAPEIAVRQVIELYNLKSSAQFNLNMASLEEKKMLGNPFMVALSCNNPFAVLNGTVCPEAFLRRKEHLWDVRLKPCYKTINEVPERVKENFSFYEFRRYSDPANPDSLDVIPISFDEWKAILIADCKEYHVKERNNVSKRLESLKVLLPENARAMMHDVDPFRIFYSAYMTAADQDGLIQSGLLPSQLLDQQLQDLANMREGGSDIITYGSFTEEERSEFFDLESAEIVEPSNVEAQLDLRGMRDGLTDYVRRICTAPNPDHPMYRPELYREQGECIVCGDEDTLLEWGCSNNHKICADCERGISNASENMDVLYACPTCRGDLYNLVENLGNAERILRPIVWYYRVRDRGQQVKQYLAAKYQDFADFLARNKWLQVTLTIAVVAAYVSGVSYLQAYFDLREDRRDERRFDLWAEAGDPRTLTFIERFGIWFRTKSRTMPRSEYHDRMQIIDPANHYSLGIDELASLRQQYGHDGLTFAQMDDEQPSTSTATRIRGVSSTNLTRPLHGELLRCLWDEITPVPTAGSLCRHVNLKRGDTSDIWYEQDNEGNGYWTYGAYQGEQIRDAPCQFTTCPWRDNIGRFDFLNRWAWQHTTEIVQKKRHWEQTGGTFPLPMEFMSQESADVLDARRSALHAAVAAYSGQTWWEYASEKFKSFGKYIKIGLALAAGIASFIAAFKLFKYFRTSGDENANEVDAQLVNSGSFNTRRLQRTMISPRQLMAEAHISEEVEQRSVRAIEKNTIFLKISYVINGVPGSRYMRGIGLFGRTYVIPGHYAKFALTKLAKTKNGEVQDLKMILERFVNRECSVEIPITTETFRMTNNDMAFGITPPEFPMFKDITNYIPTVEQHRNIGGAYLHVECSEKQQVIQTVPGTTYGVINKQRVMGNQHWDEYDIFDAYMTSYGKPGSCGAILVADINTPLFAMHVAGHGSGNPLNSTGYALPLIREDIEELKKGVAVLSYWHPVLRDAAEAHMQLQGAMMPMGAVSKQMVAYMPKKSKIIPSLLQGEITDTSGEKIPTITQPGILSPADARYKHDMSPLYHGCMKHTLPPKPFDQNILDFCVDQISSELNEVCEPLRDINQELSVKEAITGFNDRAYYDAIDLNTSAGWPWNTSDYKTKKEFIKVERDRHSNIIKCEVDQRLIDVMDMNNRLREEGIRPFTVFLDWLKDERRKEKKLALKDGTRIFSLSPIDLTIQTRQMTLDFCASFMKHRERTESAVGIVVDGSEWSRLANGLLHHSDIIVTGDYSDFGPRLASQMVRAAFKIIGRWYKYWGMRDVLRHRKLEVLCEEIANANHIMHDFVYQTMCGAPSGSAITVIINSLVNMLYIRYAWMTIFPQSDAKEFKKNVWLKVYGDDLIMAVKSEVAELFNCQTLSELFALYDIKFTDAGKTGAEKWTTIDQATFLKSAFIRHPRFEHEWLSALEKTSIYECAQWVWKSYDHVLATLENVEQSLRLAYGHGPEFFNYWKRCLNRALNRLRMKPLSLTWEHVDKQFFDGYEGNYVMCSRFDDGLGLNRYTVSNDSWLKEEVRERMSKDRIVGFLVTGAPDKVDLMTKGLVVADEEEIEEK